MSTESGKQITQLNFIFFLYRREKAQTLKLNITRRIAMFSVDIRNDGISEHGKQITSAGQHESERVLFARQIPKSLIRITQKMHQSRPQKHAAGELRPDYQKTLVPLHKVGRYPSDECPDKHQNQTPYLHQN